MKLDESNVFHNKVALFDLIPIKQRDFASAESTRAFRSPWTFGCEWFGQGHRTHEVGGRTGLSDSTFTSPL